MNKIYKVLPKCPKSFRPQGSQNNELIEFMDTREVDRYCNFKF